MTFNPGTLPPLPAELGDDFDALPSPDSVINGNPLAAPLPVYTYDQIADYLTDGFWLDQGIPPLSFDLAANGGVLTYDISGLTAAGQALALAAMQAWAEVSGIVFVEDPPGGEDPDIVFDDSDPSGAYAYSSYDGNGNIIQSVVNIPTGWLATYGTGIDSYSYQTYLHELGHALGLGHAGNYNGSATYPGDALYANDSWQATVMSYFDTNQNTFINASFGFAITPMIADIIAIQNLYGAATDTRLGNTTYGDGNDTGNAIFNLTGTAMLTLYDSGGTDTINLASRTQAQRLDLTPESISDINGRVGNLSIARGTVIENAITGSGNDTVTGNNADNVLMGNGGADWLEGRGGNDELVGGAGADILLGGSGNDSISGGSSTDQLFGGSGADTLDGGEETDVMFVDRFDIVTDTGTTGYDKAQINDPAGVALSLDGWSGVERVNGYIGNDAIDASTYGKAILLYGDDGNDTLTGSQFNDTILGGNGDDSLLGGNGNDTILGGTGNDVFDGGEGSDIFYVGESGDTVNDTGASGYDRAIINNPAGIFLDVSGWTGVERIVGYTGNDTITAAGGAEALTITGGDGNDQLTGSEVGDTFYAGNGADTVNGGGGADALIGGAGADVLDGGAGNDFLLGGADADTFVFTDGFGRDVIKDFTDGVDLIDFSGHAGVTSLSDLEIVADGSNTVIRLAGGGDDVITLVGVAPEDIDAGDFIFI